MKNQNRHHLLLSAFAVALVAFSQAEACADEMLDGLKQSYGFAVWRGMTETNPDDIISGLSL